MFDDPNGKPIEAEEPEEFEEEPEADEDEEIEDDDSELEAADGEELEEDEEELVSEPLVSVEYDGVAYEVPEPLSKGIMQERDYTQKTQSLAEEKRLLAQEREQWEASRKLDEEDMRLNSELYSVQNQLKQYEAVNWAELRYNDPERANALFQDYQILQNQENSLRQNVETRTHERTQKAQQEIAKRQEQASKWIMENVPDWGVIAPEVEAYLVSVGEDVQTWMEKVTPARVRQAIDGYKLQKAATNAAKPKKKKAGNIQPTRTVKAKSKTPTGRKDLSEVSVEEYQRLRKQGANPRLSG